MFCPDKDLRDLALKQKQKGNNGQWNPRVQEEPADEGEEHGDEYRQSGRSLPCDVEVPATLGADGVHERSLLEGGALFRQWDSRNGSSRLFKRDFIAAVWAADECPEHA